MATPTTANQFGRRSAANGVNAGEHVFQWDPSDGNDTVDGGANDDTIFYSRSSDVRLGGDGDDFIDRQHGDDAASLRGGQRRLPGGSG